MKPHRRIFAAAAVLYLALLWVCWQVGTRNAFARTRRLIERSESDFTTTICSSVDTVLLHDCYIMLCELGDDPWATDGDELRERARRFRIDEINLIDTNGVIAVSSVPSLEGCRMDDHPKSREFLRLLHGTKLFSQPFRPGAHLPHVFRKYYGMAMPGGFIQLGMDFTRVSESLYCLTRDDLRAWPFGRLGHYDVYDSDGDGNCEYGGGIPPDGEIRRVDHRGEDVFIRPFSYCGKRYLSVLPAREYFDVRNVNFSIFAPMLAVAMAFLAYFVLTISRSAERERRLLSVRDAARSNDLRVAKAIQLSVLPIAGRFRKLLFSASFAAATRPAKEVGGDFHDFHILDSSHIAILVADVSGKGIAAAMFMMKAKNEILAAIGSERDLANALANANARICENNDAELFVTAWVGLLDRHSGEIEYVNAGHNRPFVRRADGRTEKITGRGGLILGMFPEAKYRVNRLTLNPNDLLFLFTDGVTEAMDSAMRPFGEERLVAALAGCPPDPDAAIERVSAAVRGHVGGAEQSDDFTAFALVWHGDPERLTQSFAANADSLRPAMEWLSRTIALADRKSKSRLLNAADEMMTNIVNYSGATEFTLTVENSLRRSRLTFVDAGREYNPLSHADPDTRLALEQRPDGGLGILMTKRLVDAVHYSRSDGRNCLALVKLDAWRRAAPDDSRGRP